MSDRYDLNEVVRKFLRKQYPERPELIREIGFALNSSPQFKELLIEICTECVKEGLDPVHSVRTGMLFGLVVGILLEKERTQRIKL